MRDEMKKVPRLRFRGFSEDWELCKLSGVIEKLSGGASIKPTDYLEDGIRTIPKGAVNATGIADLSGSKYISEDFFEKNITSHVHTNNLVTSLRDLVPSAPNMGRIVRIEGDEEQFLMPQGVYKLELFEGMDGDFLISFSNSDKYRKIISAEKNGSTQVHIRNGEFLNIDINLPSKYEQKKIGAFFKQLDDTITLHQRKLDQLKELKKAYLQLMFPKKDETVPRVRFADFEDDWQHRKVEELGDTFTGLTGKTKEDFGHGDATFVTYINVFSNPITDLKMTESVEIDAKQNQVEYGDIFFTTSSETPEEVGMSSVWLGNEANVYLNSFCFGYRPVTELAPYYMAFMLRSPNVRKKFIFLAQGISRYNISKNRVMDIEIPVPNIDEQRKVGQFFKDIDDLITLHQNKLDQLKTLKKTYLQNMFI